jgi:dihydroxy-acid dehydratase
MLRAVGFGDADFEKPIVAVANAYSTITPCNMGLNDLAVRAIRSLGEAGTMPQVFGTITVSDGISMGTETRLPWSGLVWWNVYSKHNVSGD